MLNRLLLGVCGVLILNACGGGGSSGSHSPGGSNSVASIASSSLVASSAAQSSFSPVSQASASSVTTSVSSVINSSGSSVSSQSGNSAYLGQVAVLGDVGNLPVVGIASPSYSPIVDEVLVLDWFAYSSQQNISSVTWAQVSGPSVKITPETGLVKLQASAAGKVVIEAKATDKLGQTSTAQVEYTVKAPFSAKAKLLAGRSDGVGVDLVIVGDGFTADQQDQLLAAAKNFMKNFSNIDSKGITPHIPLWNFWVVDSVSASDVIASSGANGGSNTLFKSYFNCNSIARLLCVDTGLVTPYVATHVPQYDLILVAVNSTTYGGAGYEGIRVATFSLSQSAYQVAVHELGHSFANLGDEYDSNDGQSVPSGELSLPDLTTEKNPRVVKWAHWINDIQNIAGFDRPQTDPLEVGYFQGGAYVSTGVWRPTFTSMMRELSKPLGSVNSEAWAISVWKFSPLNTEPRELISENNQRRIFYTPSIGGSHIQTINWTLNDQAIAGSDNKNFVLAASGSVNNTLKVSLRDATGLIRKNPQNVGEITHTFSAP